MRKSLIFLIFLCFPVWASPSVPETSCTTVILDQSLLGKVRDQGKISWCYAFTAADMLAYTFDDSTRISAIDVALNYNNSFMGRLIDTFTSYGTPHETGFIKTALNQAMKDGFCPEEIFPSEEWIKVSPESERIVKMPEAMKEISTLFDRKHNLTLHNLPFYFKFHNVDKEEFLVLLQSAKKLRKFYSSLREKVCGDHRKASDALWKVKMTFRNKKIFSRINEQLNLGRMIALDYDARILENPHHRGVKLSELHTSAIYGRRWNEEKNTCEYLIRNSYGESCDRYHESYECREGNLWLTESQIYGSMTSIVYMLHTPKI